MSGKYFVFGPWIVLFTLCQREHLSHILPRHRLVNLVNHDAKHCSRVHRVQHCVVFVCIWLGHFLNLVDFRKNLIFHRSHCSGGKLVRLVNSPLGSSSRHHAQDSTLLPRSSTLICRATPASFSTIDTWIVVLKMICMGIIFRVARIHKSMLVHHWTIWTLSVNCFNSSRSILSTSSNSWNTSRPLHCVDMIWILV